MNTVGAKAKRKPFRASVVPCEFSVVDDETDLADAIATLLRREGYAVDTANDGAGDGAREQLAFNEYDLITLDLTLPDADGRDICREIRSGKLGNASVRVLMVTARDAVEDRVGGLDDGADDYLVKPFVYGSCPPGSVVCSGAWQGPPVRQWCSRRSLSTTTRQGPARTSHQSSSRRRSLRCFATS